MSPKLVSVCLTTNAALRLGRLLFGKMHMVTVVCEWCGISFEKFPSRANRVNRHLCCREHLALWKKGRPSYKRTAEHRARMSEVQKSNVALMQQHGDRIRKHNLDVKKGHSWDEIYGPRKAAQLRQHYRKITRGKRNPNYGNSVLSGESNPNWRGGVSKQPYSFEFDETLKIEIRQRDGNRCVICGISEKVHRQKYPLQYHLSIHHIDYDKTNCDPSNLVSLCKSCHSASNHRRKYHRRIFTEYIADIEQRLSSQSENSEPASGTAHDLRPKDFPRAGSSSYTQLSLPGLQAIHPTRRPPDNN